MTTLLTKLKEQKVQLLIIVILTALAYANIFKNDFAADDIGYVFNWDLPKHVQNIPKILTTESVPADERGVYRPGKSLFIMASYYLWRFNAFGYHLNGLLVHLANTVLVYLIVETLISADLKRRLALIPFATTLLFGLHPVQTEAVTFVTASFDTLGWTFYLASFWCYLKARKIGEKGVMGKRWGLAGVVFAALAFFTYELTLSLPLVLILADQTLIRRRLKLTGADSLGRYAPYFAVLIVYLVVRFLILDVGTRGDYLGDSFYKTQLVMTFAWVKYLWLLVWPFDLSIDHRLAPGIYAVVYKAFVSTSTLDSLSIFSPRVLLNLGILGGLGILGVYFWKKVPMITFAIFWFFLTLLPASYLLPQSSIMAERYLYLATFGFALVGAGLLLIGAGRVTVPKLAVWLVIGAIVVGYMTRIHIRNRDYKDTLTFWTKLADQAPDNVMTNYTLAKIQTEKGNDDSAIVYFKKALAIQPQALDINFRLGRLYQKSGQLEESVANYQSALLAGNKGSVFAKWELERLARIAKFGRLEGGVPKNGWSQYQFGPLSFSYPAWWLVTRGENRIFFDSPDDNFSVEFSLSRLKEGQTPQDYLAGTREVGNLVKLTETKIGEADFGVAKFFKDESVERLEIFLFKGSTVIKIWVYPVDSAAIKEFDRILGTIEIN